MSKKQGVKKGSAQAVSYALELAHNAAQHDAEMRYFARTYMLDMVTLALGRMGFREKKFQQFDKVLAEVCDEFGADSMADVKVDADIWYTKATLDREIKSYVGKFFMPWEQRYGFKPSKPVPMTHGLDIRTMPYKDLAHFLATWEPKSEEEVLEWLKEEVEATE